MEKLYQKIKMDDFEKVKTELLKLIPESKLTYTDSITSFWLPINEVMDSCPSLQNFAKEKIKKRISQIKFYVSPPRLGIEPHTDGTEIRKSFFSLIIPILNTENTFHVFYKNNEKNLDIKNHQDTLDDNFKSPLPKILVPKNLDDLEVIDKLEITVPTFTRSDVMHSVINNNNTIRITAVLRWWIFYNLEDIIPDKSIFID
jgi:hypothetical protein